MTLLPDCSAMPLADQLVVPVAVPEPPALFDQVTCDTPTLSLAVPLIVSGDVDVAYVDPEVGPVMLTAGACVSGAGAVAPVTDVVMSVVTSAALSARLYTRTSSIAPWKYWP